MYMAAPDDSDSDSERQNNITALFAPAPIDKREEESRPDLEDSWHRPEHPAGDNDDDQGDEDEEGLAEITAPSPVDRRSDETRPDLEDARSGRHHRSSRPQDFSRDDVKDDGDAWKDGDDNADSIAADHANRRRDDQHKRMESGNSTSADPSANAKDSDPHERRSRFATQLYIVSYLIFTSFLGTMARLGVQWLTFYPGAPVVISNLWANFGGTLFMGFLQEDRNLFRAEPGTVRPFTPEGHEKKDEQETANARRTAVAAHKKAKKTIPLFIGLATGFCGSFTSFSTFMRDVFFALSNHVPTPINHPDDNSVEPGRTVPRNPGYDFEAVLAIILLTMCIVVSSLHFGAYIAIALDRIMPTLPFRLLRKFVDRIMVVIAFGCWLCVILLAVWPPDRPGGTTSVGPWFSETWRSSALFALVFSPIGCMLRYYLSLKLNALVPWFPLGTFAANMFGTAVLSMCYDIQHIPFSSRRNRDVGGGQLACAVLQGLQDGFCGSLTTVSTWVVELTTLQARHAWFYGASSILVATACTVVIMGSVSWTMGFSQAACFVVYS